MGQHLKAGPLLRKGHYRYCSHLAEVDVVVVLSFTLFYAWRLWTVVMNCSYSEGLGDTSSCPVLHRTQEAQQDLKKSLKVKQFWTALIL